MSAYHNNVKQELPPPGGYNEIFYRRVPAQRIIGYKSFFIVSSMLTGYAFYYYAQRKKHIAVKNAEYLNQEALVKAEVDRAFLRQLRHNRNVERELMKDVPDWEKPELNWYPLKPSITPKKVEEVKPTKSSEIPPIGFRLSLLQKQGEKKANFENPTLPKTIKENIKDKPTRKGTFDWTKAPIEVEVNDKLPEEEEEVEFELEENPPKSSSAFNDDKQEPERLELIELIPGLALQVRPADDALPNKDAFREIINKPLMVEQTKSPEPNPKPKVHSKPEVALKEVVEEEDLYLDSNDSASGVRVLGTIRHLYQPRPPTTWLITYESDVHVTYEKCTFVTYKPFGSKSAYVRLEPHRGRFLPVCGVGVVKFEHFRLYVLHVPQLSCSLISLARLHQMKNLLREIRGPNLIIRHSKSEESKGKKKKQQMKTTPKVIYNERTLGDGAWRLTWVKS